DDLPPRCRQSGGRQAYPMPRHRNIYKAQWRDGGKYGLHLPGRNVGAKAIGETGTTRSGCVRYALVPITAFILAAAAVLAIWFWLGRPVPIQSEIKGKLDCLSYAP